MKKITLLAGMAIMLSCLLSVVADGQVPGGVPGPEPVSPTKAKAIRRLLDLMGSEKVGQQMLDQMLPMARRSARDVPDSVWADIEKEFSSDLTSGNFVERIIPIYSRQFTDEDINSLIAFYESPIGKKLTAAMPTIANEAMAAGRQWGFEVMERIKNRLKQKGYSVSTD